MQSISMMFKTFMSYKNIVVTRAVNECKMMIGYVIPWNQLKKEIRSRLGKNELDGKVA